MLQVIKTRLVDVVESNLLYVYHIPTESPSPFCVSYQATMPCYVTAPVFLHKCITASIVSKHIIKLMTYIAYMSTVDMFVRTRVHQAQTLSRDIVNHTINKTPYVTKYNCPVALNNTHAMHLVKWGK